MTRIAMFAALVALVVLVIAGPGRAESAGELRVAERTITVGLAPISGGVSILPTRGSVQVQPGWFKGIEDRKRQVKAYDVRRESAAVLAASRGSKGRR